MRILLLLATNLAVVILASVTLRLLGFDSYFEQQGLNFTALLVFAAVIGFGGSFVSLFLSKWLAKKTTRARVIERPSNPAEQWLVETVQQIAREAGVEAPEVAIFPAQQSNAFATGWNRNAALVAVSEGMLQRFNKEEIRAVLAHEMGHVANGDMVTLTLIQGVVNTFVIFLARVVGFIVDRAVFRNEQGHGIGFILVTIVAEIVLGILASTIVFWFSRRREFRADAAGARWGSNEAMISALQRLKRETELPDQMPDSMQAFGITSGMRSGLQKLFASHPPLDERIEALRNRTHH